MKKQTKAKSAKSKKTGAPAKKLEKKIDYHTCKIAFKDFGITFDYSPVANLNADPPYISSTDKKAYDNLLAPFRAGGASGKVGVPDAAFARKQHWRTFSHERTSQIAYYLDVTSGWKFTGKGFSLKRKGARGHFGNPKKFSRPKISPSGKVCEVTYKPGGTKGAEFQYELYLEADIAATAGTDRPAYVKIIIDPGGNNGMIPPG